MKEGLFACAHIYVEVDLEKGLPEAIKFCIDNWTHIQEVDYDEIPFKFKSCHEYRHFSHECSKWETIEVQDDP